MEKLLFFAVAIQMIGFGAVIPSMPYLLRELGGDASTQGLLVSLYSFMQLVTAPAWGYLSDKIGRSRVAAVGLLLAAAGQTAAYFAGDIRLLALGRAVAGVGGGTLPALQAMFLDFSPPARRASSMAIFGAAFGVGFVLGPALGGVLTTFSPRLPFLAAALLSIAASVLMANVPNVKAKTEAGLDLSLGLLSLPVLMLNLGFSMFEGLLSYFAAFAVSLTPVEIGLLLALAGISSGAAHPIVKKLESRLEPRLGAALGLAAAAAGLAGLALSPTKTAIFVTVAVATAGQVTAASFIFSLISKSTGFRLGVLQSAGSLGRLIGPSVGGFIYNITPTGPIIAAALVITSTALLIYIIGQRQL